MDLSTPERRAAFWLYPCFIRVSSVAAYAG